MKLDFKKKNSKEKKEKRKRLLTFWMVLNLRYALTQQLAIHFDWCYLIF